jgi:hypothetical protein
LEFVGLLLNVNVGADVSIGPYNGIILIDKPEFLRMMQRCRATPNVVVMTAR